MEDFSVTETEFVLISRAVVTCWLSLGSRVFSCCGSSQGTCE
jgi:hypothetical protein